MQGSDVFYEDYPNAYTTILKEFENGTETIYADDDA